MCWGFSLESAIRDANSSRLPNLGITERHSKSLLERDPKHAVLIKSGAYSENKYGVSATNDERKKLMSYPATQPSGPASMEERVTALEENAKKNNKNLTDTLKQLIATLEEARATECELPPYCEKTDAKV